MSALLPRNSGRCARSTAPQLLPTPPLAAATPKRPPSRSGRSEAIAQALARRGRPGRGGACVEGRPLVRWAEGRGQGWGRRNFLRLRLGSGLQSRLRLVSQSLRTGLVGCEVQPHRYQCGPAPAVLLQGATCRNSGILRGSLRGRESGQTVKVSPQRHLPIHSVISIHLFQEFYRANRHHPKKSYFTILYS